MRKILLGVIVLLLVALGVMSVTKGISIGSFEVSSIEQMSEQNQKIDKKIEEINTLIDTEYPKKLQDLDSASKKMKEAREDYLQASTISTNEEIIKAMQGKVFKIEFLWTRLGQHVRNEEVVLDFQIVGSSIGASKASDLKFTVTGTYTRITNFIYAIENDPDLDFRIENFQLIPNGSDVLLKGTFTVKNVVIEGNTSRLDVNTTGTQRTTETKATTTNTTTKVESKNTNTVGDTSTTTNTNSVNTNTTNTNTVNTNTTNTNNANTNATSTNTTSTNTTTENTTNTTSANTNVGN